MKINNTQNLQYAFKNTPSFGSLKVCNGAVIRHLSDGTKKLVPVEFHLLRAEDIADIKKIAEKWSTTPFGKKITDAFLNSVESQIPSKKQQEGLNVFNVFALKPANPSDFGSDEPLCLAMLTRLSNGKLTSIMLSYLQTAGEHMYETANRTVSGCGEMMLYGLAKFINSIKNNEFYFVTGGKTRNFYEKTLQVKAMSPRFPRFEPDSEELADFLERTETKYSLPKGIKLSNQTLEEIYKNTYRANK